MKHVTYHTSDHTAYISLNRPDSHNAFDDAMIKRLPSYACEQLMMTMFGL